MIKAKANWCSEGCIIPLTIKRKQEEKEMKRRIIGLLMAMCLGSNAVHGLLTEHPKRRKLQRSVRVEHRRGYVATVQSKYADVTDAPTFKIGFTHTPPSDTLSAAYHRVLDYTAAEFGCEMVYGEVTSGDLSEWQAAYENLGQAGCDGEIIIYCTGATVEYFDSKGIYWASVCSEIVDEDIIQMACASEYYCGNICEVDEQAGYDMAQGHVRRRLPLHRIPRPHSWNERVP